MQRFGRKDLVRSIGCCTRGEAVEHGRCLSTAADELFKMVAESPT
jgi:hypothetical protein